MDPLREYIHLTRREFLTSAAGGIGGLALASLLANNVLASEVNPGKKNTLVWTVRTGRTALRRRAIVDARVVVRAG